MFVVDNSGWQISPTSDSVPVVLDAWSRRVIGYAISHLLERASAWPRSTPRSIFGARGPAFHHSAAGFNTRLKHTHGLLPRLYDPSAHVESFFKTLKQGDFANDYSTIDDVADRLPHFLEEVYNRRRLHSSLGYMPPEEFESIHAA